MPPSLVWFSHDPVPAGADAVGQSKADFAAGPNPDFAAGPNLDFAAGRSLDVAAGPNLEAPSGQSLDAGERPNPPTRSCSVARRGAQSMRCQRAVSPAHGI